MQGGENLDDKLCTVAEVAEYFQVHFKTVQRWIREGKLPAFKVGRAYRIKQVDLNAIIEEVKA